MDLADLGLRFTPAGDAEANRALDQIAEKSAKAEKATDSLARSQGAAKTATGQAIQELLRSVQAIETMMRAQGGLASATEAATRATTTATTATGALASAQREGVTASKALGVQAEVTASNVVTAARRAADGQITEAKRVADFNAAIARGDLVKTVNPTNGVVSFAAPIMVKEVQKTTAAVADLAVAQKVLAKESQVAGSTFADFFVEHDFAREYQRTTEATFGLSKANQGLSGILGETGSAALGMLSAMAGVAVAQFAFEALKAAIAASETTMKNAEASARGYANAMNIAAEAINGVAIATYKLADANKESARQGLAKQIADNQAEIARLEKPSLTTTVGRALAGPAGGIARNVDLAQANTLRARNAALLGESIKLTLSDNRAQQDANKIIDEALPKQAALAKIHADRAKLVRQLNMHQGDATKLQAAINALDAKAIDLGKDHTKVHVARAAALTDEQRAFNSVLQGGLNYADSLAKQRDEIGLTAEERVSYLAGLELDKLATITQTKEVVALTQAIKDNRDALIARMGLADLEGAAKATATTRRNAPNITPELDAATANADALNNYADLLDQTAAHTRDAAQGMADAFGQVGGAVGNLASVLADLDAKQSDIAARRAAEEERYQAVKAKSGVTQAEIDRAQLQRDKGLLMADRESKQATLKGYGDQISAVKGFFNEKSRAYKALTIAEQAFRVLELYNSVRAMVQKALEHSTDAAGAGLAAGATVGAEAVKTSTSLAGAAIRIPLKIAEGAATMFQTLGPFAFPVIGAMLAVMAGLGFSGKGSAGSAPTSEDRQKTQGTGSVLGDASAKSESIAKSLEIVAANSNKDFEYYNPMLRALKSIDNNIGTLTAALARQLGVGGAFDTSNLGLGSTTKGSNGFLGLGVLGNLAGISPFKKKTSTTLLDQGIEFNPQTLGQIATGGINGSSYADVSTNTKKSFLGITYSNKTKTSTQTTGLDSDILAEVQRVISSLRDGVLSAASVLGVDGAKATLDAFQVNLGKISFKDMTGQEIQDTLNAVFGKLGDDLAAAVLPDIEKFQKAGEGALETLVRVARGYQVVDVSLQSIGRTFGAVGVASIEARQRLIDLVGSIDDLAEQTQFFADNFLTDIERMAPIQASVTKELERLNLSQVKTKEQFKQVVLGLDLTTEAGAQMYASLLALAPAFAKVADYVTDGSKEMQDALSDLRDAYQAQADTIQATIDKFQTFADNLKKFRDSLDTGANALLSPEAQYQATQKAFLDVSAKAKLGDAEALGNLQSVSQSYLDASKAYYASSGNYFKDLEAVKAAVTAAQGTAQRTVDNATLQLQALKDLVSPLIDINKSVKSVEAAILAVNNIKAQQTAAVATATANLYPATTGTTAGTGTGTGTTSTAPNWSTYLTHYADVANEYAANVAGKDPRFKTAEEYAQWHYQTFGQAEGRVPFKTGGSFMVGGSGGEDSQHFGPFSASPGEMINITRPGQANDNDALISLIRELIAEVKADKPQRAQIAQALLDAHDKSARKVSSAVERGPTNARLARGG